MPSPFDSLPEPRVLAAEPYPGASSVVGNVFRKTDTTYKFFWFLALLEHSKIAEKNAPLTLPIREIAREMVAQAWPCRRLFKLWFGHQDRLQTLIDDLAEQTGLADNANLHEVQAAAQRLAPDELRILEDYVPYRFLTPWLTSALIGVADHARHGLIQLLAERSQASPRPTPYRFDTVIGRPSAVELPWRWVVFLQSNHRPLRDFTHLALARYFESRNPGVPAIVNKLERPGFRRLEKARIFWDYYRDSGQLRCIYSRTLLTAEYDIDHFLPWSFVTHDLIWNLTPVTRTVNNAKRDAIPSLTRYLPDLIEQHFTALNRLPDALRRTRGAHFKAFESVQQEYSTLLRVPASELPRIDRAGFEDVYRNEIQAQAEIAHRMNFLSDWTMT
jgi:HNH endonuclease